MKIYIMNHPERDVPEYYEYLQNDLGTENVILWKKLSKEKYPVKQVLIEICKHALNNKEDKILIMTENAILCKKFVELSILIDIKSDTDILILSSSKEYLVEHQEFNIIQGAYPPMKPAIWINEDGTKSETAIVEALINCWGFILSSKIMKFVIKHQKSPSIFAPLFTDYECDETLLIDIIIRENLKWYYCNPPLVTSTRNENIENHIKSPFLLTQKFDEEYNLLPSAIHFFS